MWVRSQDKLSLVNVDDFYIHPRNKGFAIVAGRGFDLATYTYKEQALKVLNEIHKYLNYFLDEKEDNNIRRVYQMPEDKKV